MTNNLWILLGLLILCGCDDHVCSGASCRCAVGVETGRTWELYQLPDGTWANREVPVCELPEDIDGLDGDGALDLG